MMLFEPASQETCLKPIVISLRGDGEPMAHITDIEIPLGHAGREV